MPEDVDDIIEIVLDRSNSYSRHRFISIVGKSKHPEAERVLISLLDDNEVIVSVVRALKRKNCFTPYKTIKALEEKYAVLVAQKRKRSKDIHEDRLLWVEYDTIKFKYKEIKKYTQKAEKKLGLSTTS